jgi:site-specific recombinase XerD
LQFFEIETFYSLLNAVSVSLIEMLNGTTIRNANTRAAYGRAAGAFLRWCEDRGIRRVKDVQPLHVAGYMEQLQGGALGSDREATPRLHPRAI